MGHSFWLAIAKNQPQTIEFLECFFARIEEYWEVCMARDWAMTKAWLPKKTVLLELAWPQIFKQQLKICDVVYFQPGNVEMLHETLNTIPGWIDLLQNKTVICTVAALDMLKPYFDTQNLSLPSPKLRPGEFVVYDY